jgi:RNA polymerase sigma factor (sigma-70 family)
MASDTTSWPPLRGDEAELFHAYQPILSEAVSGYVRTAEANVDDACAYAWSQFMRYQPDRDANWRGWLFRVAQREALRLQKQQERELPTAGDALPQALGEVVDPHDRAKEHAQLRDAIDLLGRLKPRLREVTLLNAIGMKFHEIADAKGISQTRVDQLRRRAQVELYAAAAEQRSERGHDAPRAARLAQLERDTPDWLLEKIGRPPRGRKHPVANLLAWRRAAVALDDLRQAREDTLSRPAEGGQLVRLRERAERATAHFQELRHPELVLSRER